MNSPLTSTGKTKKHLTVTEIEAYMKRRCFLIVCNAKGEGKIKVEVNITDYRFDFGNHRFLISPKAGTGEAWRDITQLEFE